MNNSIKVGIVGYGKSAQYFHIPLIKAEPKLSLHSIVQRSGTSAAKEHPGTEVIPDFKTLLKSDAIQLIVITTPNHLHYEQARQALSTGRHVVVEKPFTVGYDEAQSLIHLARDNQVKVSVFQNRRWDGDFLTLKKLLKENAVGEVVELESTFNRFRNELRPGAWKEKDLPGSGILYDLGPHLIDQALQLFGKPDSVYADIRAQRGGDTDDYFDLHLYYSDKKVALMAGMLVADETPRFVLRGTKGSFVKFGMDPQEEKLKNGEDCSHEEWGVEDPQDWGTLYSADGDKHLERKIETVNGVYPVFYKKLAGSIINAEELPVNPEDAAEVIRLIELALKSDELGKRMDF